MKITVASILVGLTLAFPNLSWQVNLSSKFSTSDFAQAFQSF
jgi:hypothetical protein